MTAPTFTSNYASTTVLDIQGTYPAGIQKGDKLLIIAGEQTTAPAWTFPQGFVQISSPGSSRTNNNVVVAEKTAVGTESGTFLVSSTALRRKSIIVVRWPDAGVVDSCIGNNGLSAAAITSVTTAIAELHSKALYVACQSSAGPRTWSLLPTGYVEGTHVDVSVASSVVIAAFYRDDTGIDTETGPLSVTASAANVWTSINLVLKKRSVSSWSEWNGSVEVPLTLEGEWNGSVVVPLSFGETVV